MSKSTWLVHHPRSCVLYLFPASLPTPTRLVLLLAERDRLLLLLGDFTGEGLAFLVPHKDVLRRNAKQKRGERVADAMPATITIQAQARSLSLSLSLSLFHIRTPSLTSFSAVAALRVALSSLDSGRGPDLSAEVGLKHCRKPIGDDDKEEEEEENRQVETRESAIESKRRHTDRD